MSDEVRQPNMGLTTTVFLRKATGLVKGWSAFDGFMYSAMTINLMLLGFGYAFTTLAFIPNGSLVYAIVLSGVFMFFEVLTYACMISVMPRAGGDYVWQSRVFGGAVGFVLGVTGWWFILWHWAPIYGQIFAVEVIQPVLTLVGFTGTAPFHADWWAYSATSGTGIFVTSLITILMVAVLCGAGLRWYAKFQKWCFWGGMIGLLIMFVAFLTHTKADFIAGFNHNAATLFDAGPNAYQRTLLAAKSANQASFPGFGSLPLATTFLLVPFMLFWNLWPNWGATMYGEVRGATDFRKNLAAMTSALLVMTVLAVLAFAAMAHSMGSNFYGVLSSAYWGYFKAPVSFFPYPGMLAVFFFDNRVLQLVVIGLLSLWFFGGVGPLFLSSTRVIFAAAFDRILPEWAAKVTDRRHVPIGALLLMVIPAIPIAAAYAYSQRFYTYTFDAVLVLVVTYMATTAAAIVLPWRRPEIYKASPIARYKIFGVPLITVSGLIFFGFLGFATFEWLTKDIYGVNNRGSFLYMGVLYLVAIGIYATARVVRRRQGIDLKAVHREIPLE